MKWWLVFNDDNGNREDCNVFYSNLVRADTQAEAVQKVIDAYGDDDGDLIAFEWVEDPEHPGVFAQQGEAGR